MQKITFTLIALVLVAMSLSAQTINHLVYKNTVIKSPYKVVKVGLAKECDVTINGNLLKVHNAEYNGGKLLQQSTILYDLAKNIRVVTFENNSYNIEVIDTICKINTTLVSTGETRVIKGLNCEKFQGKGVIKARVGSEVSAGYIPAVAESYAFWVTKDIVLDSRINRIILKAFTKFISADIQGVLVQVDYGVVDPNNSSQADMSLAIKETVAIDETQFVMPWTQGDKYKAAVADPFRTDFQGYTTSTDEDKATMKRQIALLASTLGQEKPKYLVKNMYIVE
jgi:hypothetical protein